MPDEIVRPMSLSRLQQELRAPNFSFALYLTVGKVAGLQSFRASAPIDFQNAVVSDEICG